MKKRKKYLFEKGAIALPSVLILSAVLLAIALALSLSSNSQNNMTQSKDKSIRAFYIAEAGIKDAEEKIARNKNYDTNYNLPLNGGNAAITIDNSIPSNTIVTSEGTLENNTKTIEVILNVDGNGKALQSSWKES